MVRNIKNKYNLKELNIQHLWTKTMKDYVLSIIFDIFLLITFCIVVDINNLVLSSTLSEGFWKDFFNKRKGGISLTD